MPKLIQNIESFEHDIALWFDRHFKHHDADKVNDAHADFKEIMTTHTVEATNGSQISSTESATINAGNMPEEPKQ